MKKNHLRITFKPYKKNINTRGEVMMKNDGIKDARFRKVDGYLWG